jgi:hypothetical protein
MGSVAEFKFSECSRRKPICRRNRARLKGFSSLARAEDGWIDRVWVQYDSRFFACFEIVISDIDTATTQPRCELTLLERHREH